MNNFQPVSQSIPVYPVAHMQLNDAMSSWHAALFRQGLLSHSLMAANYK